MYEQEKLSLVRTKRTDPRLLALMPVHYSQPKGFVGRSLCYAIMVDDDYYGHIVAGSATRFLPGRNVALGIPEEASLNNIVNNTFYHAQRVNGVYPWRNFTTTVVRRWRYQVGRDWFYEYGDNVRGFETLVELPRTGELYLRDGWGEVGVTKGYTCKRVAGTGSDSWTGKRVWNTNPDTLRPKRVLVRLHPGADLADFV